MFISLSHELQANIENGTFKNNNMKLTIKWDEFSNQIDEYATEAKSISAIENTIKTEQEFEKVNTDIKNWSERCYEFIKSSFGLPLFQLY